MARGYDGGQRYRRTAVDRPPAEQPDLPAESVLVPLALARLHHALPVDALVSLTIPRWRPDGTNGIPHGDAAAWAPAHLADVLAGGGFDVVRVEIGDEAIRAQVRRARTLPDTVGPSMRLLVCGLNPSVYSADRGVGYARPGNRFWPAALDAGLVRIDRDPLDALQSCGVGMTDVVKRATVGAAELTTAEYRRGVGRVDRLVRWLRPGAVCFVGLAGWRAAISPKAVAGLQPEPFGGRPAYVMPSTSGLNAHSSRAALAAHLGEAAALATSAARASADTGCELPW